MTKEELQAKYNTLAAHLGETVYRIKRLQAVETQLLQAIASLDEEAKKLEQSNEAQKTEVDANGSSSPA